MKVKCPCCRQKIGRGQLKRLSTLLPFDGMMMIRGKDHVGSFMKVVTYSSILYQWACDDCLDSKKAILANPRKQYHTFNHPMDAASPYLAYFDKRFTCEQCGEPATFSKEEQQYWYEQLRFVVFSRPKFCQACRKEIRAQKALNTELSELLKEEATLSDKVKLLRVAEIYMEMDKPEKAKYYLAMAGKLDKKRS